VDDRVPLVYSQDRVRRLRLVLAVGVIAGGLLALLGVASVASDADLRRVGLAVCAIGLVVLGLAVATLRSLAARDARARTLATVTGAVTLVSGFFFARNILGFAMIVLGLTVLVLARLRDDPGLES
jgi:hypothetical protein